MPTTVRSVRRRLNDASTSFASLHRALRRLHMRLKDCLLQLHSTFNELGSLLVIGQKERVLIPVRPMSRRTIRRPLSS